MKHLLEHYDVLSATRIEAMRNILARLESMAPPSRSSSDVVSPDSPESHANADDHVTTNVAPTNGARSATDSPTRDQDDAPKKTAEKRIPIVVDAPSSNGGVGGGAGGAGGGGGGGYNPTALLAMLDEQSNDKSSHVAGKRNAKKSRKASVSAISADTLHALNAGVDDDSSGDDSGALPPPAEPEPAKPTIVVEPAKLHLDDAAVASILDARERNQWALGSTAEHGQSAKALVGTIAPAPSIAVADLDELRRQVQIMATSATADVDDDDADNDVEETKMRAVPYKALSSGHVAPAPTAATTQLEDFRAQAQALGARGEVLELDPSLVDKILADRKVGAFGGALDRSSSGISALSAPRSGVSAPRPTAATKDLTDYKDAAAQLAQRLAVIANDTHDDSSDHSAASSVSDASPQVQLATPTKNDPKRLRALAFTPSQPPSTGIASQLADFKAQAEALAAQLRDAVADAGDDALSSGESARDDDDPADPASETTDTPPKHGSLRDPAEKQRPSAKKKAALLYTPKAPAPTGAAPELVDFRSQAMQLAEQLRSLADEGGVDDESSISSALSPPGSETPSLAPTLRYGEGVRAPAPTMKEKQLASYAAQAELLVAKLAEVERARKSEASSTARRHRSRSHKADGIAPDSSAAVAATSTSSAASTTTAAPAATSTSASSSMTNLAASAPPMVAGSGVVERLRTAALVRKNSKGEIDNASGSNSPNTHSPRDEAAKAAASATPSDKPQRRATKSKTTAATAVAALVTSSNSANDLTKETSKEKSGMMRRSSVARPVERPAGRAPQPPRSDKDHMTTMEQETELAAERAELKKKIDALELSWAGKPKDQSVLHELMQLGLSLADVETQLADLQDK